MKFGIEEFQEEFQIVSVRSTTLHKQIISNFLSLCSCIQDLDIYLSVTQYID
jgi:hypothetical protein